MFAVLAGCTQDLSGLDPPNHQDAGMSPDTVSTLGETGISTGAGGSVGMDGNTAAGGSHGGGMGGSGGSWAGPVDATGADALKGEFVKTPDAASWVASDSAFRTYDSGASDRAANPADRTPAAPEVGTAVPDLGTDSVPSIVLGFPAAMKCNLDGSTAELSWTALSTWEPTIDSLVCGNSGAYSVQGRIDRFQPGLQVMAEVYAPEDSTWHPISGGPTLRPDAAGGFKGSFCLPQKGLERTFRFRIVQQKTSQDLGVACLIHVGR